jgi:hypothetical protein
MHIPCIHFVCDVWQGIPGIPSRSATSWKKRCGGWRLQVAGRGVRGHGVESGEETVVAECLGKGGLRFDLQKVAVTH